MQIRKTEAGNYTILNTFDVGYLLGHIVLSSDTRLFAVGKSKGFVEIYETATGQLVKSLECRSPGMWVGSVAFAWEDQLVACSTEDDVIRLWLRPRREK